MYRSVDPSKNFFWQILEKKLNIDQKSKFWPKIYILEKNLNIYQNLNFGQKSKYLPKIKIFVKKLQKCYKISKKKLLKNKKMR